MTNALDAVTGVSGSGPAYMFLILEAMADEGVRQGLDRTTAYSLAAQTMVGAGRLLLRHTELISMIDTTRQHSHITDSTCGQNVY